MMKVYRWLLSISVAALCSIGIGGCDPSVGPPAVSLNPQPGMTVVASSYSIGSNNKPVESTRRRIWITASDTGFYQLSWGAAKLEVRNDSLLYPTSNLLFSHFLDNGDIQFFERLRDNRVDFMNDRWVTFPIGLKGEKQIVAKDTAFTRAQRQYRFKEVWTARFLGPEVITLPPTQGNPNGLEPLATVVAQIVQECTEADVDTRKLVPYQVIHTLWYSPKIRMIVKYEQFFRYDPSDVTRWSGTGWCVERYMQR